VNRYSTVEARSDQRERTTQTGTGHRSRDPKPRGQVEDRGVVQRTGAGRGRPAGVSRLCECGEPGNDLLSRCPLEPASADKRGGDSDDSVGCSVDSPGLYRQLLGPIQLRRFGDNPRHALDKNTPATQAVSLIAVGFKGEDSAGGGGVELCAFHGAKHDFAVQESEVDW